MYQIYLIFITGFGLFGLYCFVDTLLSIFSMSSFPPSITIMYNKQDDKTFKKIKYIEEAVPNNYNILYPFDSEKTEEEQQKILAEYIKNVLIVNKR